jgi:hypothetical protein
LARWSALALLFALPPPAAHGIPAFARKYGLRCTTCHEAWPALNDFGRAFRDNGYQMMRGQDDPVTTHPGYWPVAIRTVPHYEYSQNTEQPTDEGQVTVKTGRFAVDAFDLLAAGTLGKDVSFSAITAIEGGEAELESFWIRFDNIAGNSWLNVKVGHHEVDLPRSSHRPWSQTGESYLIYGYHPPGSVSTYSLGDNQDGVEYLGHDRGSLNRVAVSVFNVASDGSDGVFDTPGLYFHVTHEWLLDGYLAAAKVGLFGAHTTWPTRSLTLDGEPVAGTGKDLETSIRYGIEGQAWLGSTVTPLHLILVLARGSDNRQLIEEATRDGTFSGGFLEAAYTPTLKTTVFGRYERIDNDRQAVAENPRNLNDQSLYAIGLRYTLHYSDRAEYALHVEHSNLRTKRAAEDGSDVSSRTIFFGFDFAF